MSDEIRQKIAEKKKKQEEAHLQLSKKRLIDAIDKKFNTANIGILAILEKYFGELWGHNRGGKLTLDEQEWQKRWSLARAEILDHGNHQKRGAINEISEYTLKWEKYHINFVPASLIKKDN